MAYKILGYVVWHRRKWFFPWLFPRRRTRGTKSKAAILGAGVLVLAGVALASRPPTSNQ